MLQKEWEGNLKQLDFHPSEEEQLEMNSRDFDVSHDLTLQMNLEET